MHDNPVSRSEFDALEARLRKLENPPESKKEAYYQTYFENFFKGKHLHIPGFGRTDVTTKDMHAEIKEWKHYQVVPGQLGKYQLGSPRKILAACFFGKRPKDSRVRDIHTLMKRHNIRMYSIDDDDNIEEHDDDNLDDCSSHFQETFTRWLDNNLVPTPDTRVHLHRFERAFSKSVKPLDVSTRDVVRLLQGRGLKVSPTGNSGKHRDADCCANPARCVFYADVKEWYKVKEMYSL